MGGGARIVKGDGGLEKPLNTERKSREEPGGRSNRKARNRARERLMDNEKIKVSCQSDMREVQVRIKGNC